MSYPANYGELMDVIRSESHRPDMIEEDWIFIARAEEMIFRELRAYELSITLDEDDRDTGGIYDLPSTLVEVRALHATANGESYPLENVGVTGIRQLSTSAPVLHYAVRGQQVEFRGVPATDAEIELVYYGHPPPLDQNLNQENDLLTNHPTLYIEGALFFLFKHTQDLELAQAALDTFSNAIEKLNEQIARKNGGTSIGAAYNFGHISTGGGY